MVLLQKSGMAVGRPRCVRVVAYAVAVLLSQWLATTLYAQSITINLEVFGLNENQFALDTILDSTCPSVAASPTPTAATQDLQATCQVLNPLADDDTTLAAGLDRLIPEEAFAISDTLTDAADLQVTNVQARINNLRRRESQERSGSGASSALRFNRVEPFFNSQFANGDVDGNRLQQDADLTTSQFTAGADYRFSDSLIAGAGIGIFQNETDFRRTAGGSQVDGTNLTLFATFMREPLGYLDLVLDVGSNTYDLSRQINLQGGNQVLAVADTQSSSVSLSAGIGKNLRYADWDVNPYLRLGFTAADVDAYREQASSGDPGFGSTLALARQSVRSSTVSIGTGMARTISTGRGVLVPQVSLELEFETRNRKSPLSAYFLADPGQTEFRVEGEERDTEYLNLGLGGVAVLAGGRSAYAFYETRLGQALVTQHWIKAGVRLEF